MSPVAINLPECIEQLTRESTALDLQVVQALRDGGFKTFKDMGPIDQGGLSPVRTGNYVANMLEAINSVNPARIQKTVVVGGQRQSAKKLRKLRGNKAAIAQIRSANMAIYNQHVSQIVPMFAGKKTADIHSINISNNAPHAHLIERGASKKAPQGVFAVEETKALGNFNLP